MRIGASTDVCVARELDSCVLSAQASLDQLTFTVDDVRLCAAVFDEGMQVTEEFLRIIEDVQAVILGS